jgi:hypothetical protein
MGVDFIGRTGRTFEKHLDLARARLGTANLFTRAPMEDRPSFPIKAAGSGTTPALFRAQLGRKAPIGGFFRDLPDS